MAKMVLTIRRSVASTRCAAFFAGILLVAGCDGANPFLSAQFTGNLPPTVAGGEATARNEDSTGNAENPRVIEHVDQLPPELRTFVHSYANSSIFAIEWRALFVVTAGDGGFVRNEGDIRDYLAAGYVDLLPPDSRIGTTTTVGCVTLELTRGTRLLGMVSGETGALAGSETGDPDQFSDSTADTRRDNAEPFLPLPERIVFTTSDPRFDCENRADPCSQLAINFYDDTTLSKQIGTSVTAARIQGTMCNFGIGTAPEVRLDITPNGDTSAFEFVPGGTILWRILDRAQDTPDQKRVQVVWSVFDENLVRIHNEMP